jgi:hypothetical protein
MNLLNKSTQQTTTKQMKPQTCMKKMKIKTKLLTSTAFAVFVTAAISCLGQPVITLQPANQTVHVGDTLRLSVTATGASPLGYQWSFNGAELTSKTSASLALSGIQFSNVGSYSVVVTNGSGSVTSQVARLSVLPEDVVSLGDRELKFGKLSAPIWEAPHIDDEAPSLTGDGLTLFYGSRAPGGSGDLDIWLATRTTRSSPWSAPINLGPTVNSSAIDTIPRLSPDGLSLYFASTRPGGSGGYDLWVTSRLSPSDPFGKPVNLGSAVNSISDDALGNISADNRTMVFASNRSGGSGLDDIWMTTRAAANAPWEPALHLGPAFNTSVYDFPVALSRDGLLLFFKSNRPISEGDPVAAMYVSRRTSAEQPFGPPVLIRPILNIGSGGVDYSSLSDDGTTLYVGTYRNLYPDWPQLVEVSITPLPQLKSPGRNALGEFQCELLGREGAAYEIQASPDCITWTTWLTTNTTDSVKLSDPATEGRRFYRALSH